MNWHYWKDKYPERGQVILAYAYNGEEYLPTLGIMKMWDWPEGFNPQDQPEQYGWSYWCPLSEVPLPNPKEKK